MLRHSVTGIIHYTDFGEASWWDFAKAIQEDAVEFGILDATCEIRPISTDSYPTPATRPSYSVLDKSRTVQELGHELPDWRSNLKLCMSNWVGSGQP